MKKKYIRILSVFLALITTFSSLAITAYALSWDGSSTGGGGAGTSAGPNGCMFTEHPFTRIDTDFIRNFVFFCRRSVRIG